MSLERCDNRAFVWRHEVKFTLLVLTLLLAAGRAEAQGEAWRVRLESSGYLYARCWMEIGQFGSVGTARLWCVPNGSGSRVAGERQLSASELASMKTLVESSDFYGGGHTGLGQQIEDADFETLVVRCCTRQEWISIVVSGNRTFEQPGSRRELLQQLHKLLVEFRGH